MIRNFAADLLVLVAIPLAYVSGLLVGVASGIRTGAAQDHAHGCALCDFVHERSLLRRSGWLALLRTKIGKNRVWNAVSTAVWATKDDWRQRRRRKEHDATES